MQNIVLTALCAAGFLSLSASAQKPALQTQSNNVQRAAVDYMGFMELTNEVRNYRAARLVGKIAFMEMAAQPGTVILDTRSKDAFDMAHIDGAVHLNFSDFTQGKIDKLIGDKSTRILIYCNNNFADDRPPVPKKKIELALNIPTFINLYGYGYKNIYELADTVKLSDPAMKIVQTQ